MAQNLGKKILYDTNVKFTYPAKHIQGMVYSRWDSHTKLIGVIVENFERNPGNVPESRFVGVTQIHFYP